MLSSKTTPTDSAFPDEISYGLTKREYFAAMAMQSFVIGEDELYTSKFVASRAVRIADDLIDALNEPKEQP